MSQDIGRTSGRSASQRFIGCGSHCDAGDLVRVRSCRGAVQAADAKTSRPRIEQWGMFEVELPGPTDGNPFRRRRAHGARSNTTATSRTVTGFYDGDGVYRVRFMPDKHGPVAVHDAQQRRRTRRQDGRVRRRRADRQQSRPGARSATRSTSPTPTARRTSQLGTTCYAWTSPGRGARGADAQDARRVAVQQAADVRVSRSGTPGTRTSRRCTPFEGTPPNQWDFTRFNPAFFQHLEQRIAQLRDLGIEADIILFHPYDEGHWGFDRMPDEADDRYLRYVVSRLAAFRNVWWSLANEYDFMTEKQESDWDRMIEVVHEADPYGRLLLDPQRHACSTTTRTRCSRTPASRTARPPRTPAGRCCTATCTASRSCSTRSSTRATFRSAGATCRPRRWCTAFGRASSPARIRATASATCSPIDVLWWAKGGVLTRREPGADRVPARHAGDGAGRGHRADRQVAGTRTSAASRASTTSSTSAQSRPTKWKFQLPRRNRDDPKELAGGMQFHVDVLDTWNMTVTPVDEPFTIRQPRKTDYVVVDEDDRTIDAARTSRGMALRITRVADE